MAINDLAVHPKNHNVVWAATGSRRAVADPGRRHRWWVDRTRPEDIRAVTLSPKNPNVVYVGARTAASTRASHAGQKVALAQDGRGMDPNDSIYH